MMRRPPRSTLVPCSTLFRSIRRQVQLQPRAVGVVGGGGALVAHLHRGHEALAGRDARSEEHTSELESRQYLVCRLLLEKKEIQLFVADFCRVVTADCLVGAS